MPGLFRHPFQAPQRSRREPAVKIDVAAEIASGTGAAGDAAGALEAIRDQFLTDDAAPITTPRTAEPGNGLAVITDVESRIAILGDRLRGLSQATPVWGDSEVLYNAITRLQGRAFAALVTLEDEANGLALGLATSDPGDPTTNGHGWVVSKSASSADYRNVYAITPGKLVTIDDSTKPILTSQYLVVVMLNTRGAVVLLSTFGTMGFATLNASDPIGIPAYPSARVLWVEDANVAGALYPYVSAFGQGGTTSVNGHAVEDLRVMDVSSWSADDALGDFVDRFTRGDSSSAIGNSWTAASGTWGIDTNTAYLVTASFPSSAYHASSVADGIVSVDITVPSDWDGSNYSFGLVLRLQDASNYLRFWNNGQNAVYLQSWVGGGFGDTIDATGFTFTAGQTYRLTAVMKGNKYLLMVDGTAPTGGWTTDAGNNFLTATNHGIISGDSLGVRWDNFSVYANTVSLPSTPFDSGSRPDVTASGSALGTDTFTDTNGVSLDAHTAGAGGAWTEHLGNWSIQTNRAIVSAVAGANYATQELSQSDVDLSVDVITPSSFPTPSILAGIVFRYTDANNFMYTRLYHDGGTGEIEIGENVGGSLATVAKVALPLLTTSTTYTLRARVKGDLVYIFVNGEARLAHYMRTGSAVGTRHGLYRQSTDDGAVFDNWSGLSLAVSTSAAAESASGTGAAGAAAISLAPNASGASGTGASGGATSSVAPTAGAAAGTGAAYGPTITDGAAAGEGTGTGAAYNATISIAVSASAGTGTGAAYNPGGTISFTSGVATGTGAAGAASVSLAPNAGSGSGTGASGGPSSSIAVSPTLASGTGAAYDATVSTAVATDANAEAATGSGAAYDASASIKPASGAATGTGASGAAAISLAPNAGSGTGTGASGGPGASVAASATGASGTGASGDPTIVSGTIANPTTASGTGSAGGASLTIAATIGNAVGVGAAYDASIIYAIPSTGGGPGKHGPRRAVRRVVYQPTPVDITIRAVVPAPTVHIGVDVNDDEVVMELLAGIL